MFVSRWLILSAFLFASLTAQAEIDCEGALSADPLRIEYQNIEDLFLQTGIHRHRADAERYLLAAYFHSMHPNRDFVFERLYRAYVNADTMRFDRVKRGLDQPGAFNWDEFGRIPSRRFLRAVKLNSLEIEPIPEEIYQEILKAMTAMSKEERLIVFRQAYLQKRPIHKLRSWLHEMTYRLATDLHDENLLALASDFELLGARVKIGKVSHYKHVKKIDAQLSERSLVEYLKFMAAQPPFDQEGARGLSALVVMAGVLLAMVFAPSSGGLSMAWLGLASSVLLTSVAVKTHKYLKYYPHGNQQTILEQRLTLKASEPKLNSVIALFNDENWNGLIATKRKKANQSTSSPLMTATAAEQKTLAPETPPVAKLSLKDILSNLSKLSYTGEKETDQTVDVNTVGESWTRFNGFFTTLRRNLVSRDDLTRLMEYSLISGHRQNILLLGPAGSGKSFVAEALAQIKDMEAPEKPTTFKLLMTPETVRSEVDGPLSYSGVQNDRFERITEHSILNYKYAFLDEIFDYPRLRNLLNVLEEGVLRQGAQEFKGRLDHAIAATNKYITEIYQMLRGSNAQAPQDRFTWLYLVPNELSTLRQNQRLMNLAPEKLPDLFVQDIDALRTLVDKVAITESVELRLLYVFQSLKRKAGEAERESREEFEKLLQAGQRSQTPPYRSTRVFSGRSLRRAQRVLRTVALHDWLQKGGEGPLVAKVEHIEQMANYFKLGGPKGEFLQRLISNAADPIERQQYEIVAAEEERFEEVIGEINEYRRNSDLHKRLSKLEMAAQNGELRVTEAHLDLLSELFELHKDLEEALKKFDERANQDGDPELEVIELPELESRFNRLLDVLGIG